MLDKHKTVIYGCQAITDCLFLIIFSENVILHIFGILVHVAKYDMYYGFPVQFSLNMFCLPSSYTNLKENFEFLRSQIKLKTGKVSYAHIISGTVGLIKRPARDACLCMGELPAPAAPPAAPAPHFVFLITL